VEKQDKEIEEKKIETRKRSREKDKREPLLTYLMSTDMSRHVSSTFMKIHSKRLATRPASLFRS
jgi:hypothetical protein